MSKTQRTPIPLPGTKSASKARNTQAASSKAQLSQEFIDSSNEESESDAAPPPPKEKVKADKNKNKNALVTIGVHRPKPNGVKKTQVPVPLPKQNPTPKVVNNEELESSSSDSEESDHENVEGQEYPSRKNAGESSSEEESESSSSSDTSSSESEEGTTATPAPTATKVQSKPTQSHTVEFRPVQPFVPPKGFTAVSTPLHTSSPTVKIFENLGGKQVWHITAPAGVSMSQVKEIAIDKALAGDAFLSHKGTDYGFSAKESDEGVREVLIPRQNGYKAVPTRISRTLHLEQVIRLPNLNFEQTDQNTGSEAAASITRSTIRAPRPQIKGLKMRYFHSGFGDRKPGTLGSSDSEDNDDDDAPATDSISIPNGKQVLEKPKKRKHTGEVNGTERLESPTKKHKKHRTPEEIKEREEKKARKEKRREKERAKS